MAAVLRHSLSMNVTVQQEWVPDLEDFYSLATKMDPFRFIAIRFISRNLRDHGNFSNLTCARNIIP